MDRKKYIVIVFLLFCSTVIAQNPFSERLQAIRSELEDLSQSQAKGLNEEVNFTVANAPIQEFLRTIAETHELNIHVDPNIKVLVTNNFTNANVKDVLYFLCSEFRLDMRFVNNIMSLFPYQTPKAAPEEEKELSILYDKVNDQLTIDLKRDSLAAFVRQLTRKSGKNVLITNNLEDMLISGYINRMPFESALSQLVNANDLDVTRTEDGFYLINNGESNTAAGAAQPNSTGRNTRGNASTRNRITTRQGGSSIELSIQDRDTLISLDAENTPIIDIINEVSQLLNKNYILFSEPQGSTTGKIQQISYDDLLNFLLQGTDHTYNVQNDIYLIGERIKEGFRTTRLLKLQFRTVKEIETVIPQELTQGVQITVFPELNSLILSGGGPQINEISNFIKAIDEPVPNILIEVMVVEVRKGFNLQTGIQAMLTDSAIATQGQVFPGLDLTISSNSVNNVLERLGSRGIVNLGRVTPRFYTTLKALEDNNNVDIKSTPKLSTLNGHEANLTIGRSVYYVQETQNINPGVNPITTVSQQFRQVEANLEIKINPIVSGNEHITLDIEAEFSDFTDPEFEGAPPGNATRRFISQIRVVNEEMIVLGGLEESRSSENSSGTPILSRIPILSWLFSSKSKQKNNDQLVVFIKPTIVY